MAAKIFEKLELTWLEITKQYKWLCTCQVLRGTVGKALDFEAGDWSSISGAVVNFFSFYPQG